jgi:hypothetical protein
VITTRINSGLAGCDSGRGASFTVGNVTTYACDGTGGGGGTLGAGQGLVNVIGCASDDTQTQGVTVRLLHHFDNSPQRKDFFLDGIVLEDLPANCARSGNLMNLSFYIQDGAPFFTNGGYISGQAFECTHTFTSAEASAISTFTTVNLKLVNRNNSRLLAEKIEIDPSRDLRIDFRCDAPIQDNPYNSDEVANSIISTRDVYGSIAFEFSTPPQTP